MTKPYPLLEVKHGNFGYDEQNLLLKDISFSLNEGEILAILGPNGIGKTTLLKCTTGIFKWLSGATYINNQELCLKKKDLGSSLITYVPQAHQLSFPYTIKELVMMGRARHVGLLSTPSKKDEALVEEAMEQVKISHLKNRLTSQLSGGQLQLAFIARALAGEPKILVLDEPESHLDFKNQSLMLDLVCSLVKEKGISCMMNTHFPAHALKISNKTLMLGKGKATFGPTHEIITESRMKDYFDVNSKIVEVEDGQKTVKAFVVL